MAGINRDDAAAAIVAGWNQTQLLTLHEVARSRDFFCEFVSPFAFYVNDNLIYKNMAPGEIRTAFEDRRYDEVVAYCDGSGMTADKIAGIGVCVYTPESVKMVAENIGKGTNNRAELCAIWCALRSFPHTSQKIKIFTDSEYAIGALTHEWARNKNGVLIGNIRKDLWYRGEHVAFEHVDGHTGVEGNEVADKLATIGRKIVTRVSVYED